MIPGKKKTPEEIAALRGQLGIPEAQPEQAPTNSHPESPPAQAIPSGQHPNSPSSTPTLDPTHPYQSPELVDKERAVHLDAPLASEKKVEAVKNHSLRKHELPLAPAPAVTQKTALPDHRHDPNDMSQIRHREALAKVMQQNQQDPAAHLRKMTAHPLLLTPAYLFPLAAALAAWQRAFYLTPLVLLVISILFTFFIFLTKKRSRHHAAILTIIIVMTLTFGALYYVPFLTHAP